MMKCTISYNQLILNIMMHAQGIGIILYQFPNCNIIYPMVLVYQCTYHPPKTISSSDPKYYVGFKKVTS